MQEERERERENRNLVGSLVINFTPNNRGSPCARPVIKRPNFYDA